MNKKRGFTLIELVMVIVILGILSAVAIPTFFNLQNQAKEAAAKGALGGLRSAISIWYAKEATSGTPAWPTLTQLTVSTNGALASGIVPENPYTRSKTIKAGTVESADSTVGWIYDVNTGRLWSSAEETQGSGW